MHIACVHTAKGNIDIFERAAEGLGLPPKTLSHHLRQDLLAATEEQGWLTPQLREEVARELRQHLEEADAVLLTCSSIGPAVEDFPDSPVLRVDEALAEAALAADRKLTVLCAAQTTMEPTEALFSKVANAHGGQFQMVLVPGAWEKLKADDSDGYLHMISEAADQAYRDGADAVALAQASMTSAAERVKHGPAPYTSPKAGLAAAVKKASS